MEQGKRLDVRQTIAAMQGRKPALEGVLSLAAGISDLREEVLTQLRGVSFDVPSCAGRAPGVSLLSGTTMDWARDLLALSAAHVLPALGRLPQLEKDVAALQQALDDERLDLTGLGAAVLEQNVPEVKGRAADLSVPAATLDFVLRQILSPVLAVAAERLASEATNEGWKEGYCPICGSLPSIAYLSRANEDAELSEFLRSGGGKKFFHCSLCGQEWSFMRGTCPVCRKNDPGTIETYSANGETSERLEICTHCKIYSPCIDLRGLERTPDMHVAPVGLLPLEIRARQDGYRPLCVDYWNALE